jgi:hypothetical protein
MCALRAQLGREQGKPDSMAFVCLVYRQRIMLARIEHQRPYLTREEAAVFGVIT